MGCRCADGVDSTAGGFDDDIAARDDNVDVVAAAANQRIIEEAAGDRIVGITTVDRIAERSAIRTCALPLHDGRITRTPGLPACSRASGRPEAYFIAINMDGALAGIESNV